MNGQLISITNHIKKVLIWSILIQLPIFCFSQGEFNQWRFGNHAGLNFNFSPPVSVSGSALNNFVSVNQSDSLGNLLFYSDGSTIWNRNNAVMQNGSGLYCNTYSLSVLIIPDPGISSQYFLFTVGPWDIFPAWQGLFYSKIDMTLAGGLGGVIPGMKNIPVPGGGNVSNGIIGTCHRNNHDTWLIVRPVSPQIYQSYLITPSGLNTTPVSSNSIENYTYPLTSGPGVFPKISQDGTKLITGYAWDSVSEFCHFDNLTGTVSPQFKVQARLRGVNYGTGSGAFSKNAKYVYMFVSIPFIHPIGYPGPQVVIHRAKC